MRLQETVDRPRRVSLPTEILLMIIELPIPKDSRPILRASDPITKWLLAFTRACKTTYPVASQLLWRYCLCIDSKQRAEDFMRFLANPLYYPPRVPWKVRGTARLYLAPFPQKIESQDANGRSRPGAPGAAVEEAEPQAVEPPQPLNHGSNLGSSMNSADGDDSSEVSDSSDTSSASSFVFRYPPSPLNDLQTARTTEGILASLAPALKTLIINMPLRTLEPSSDDQGIRPILRRGFEALVNLEEIVSVRDDLYLVGTDSYMEEHVWTTYWPKLRRVSLYNPDVDEYLWSAMAQLRDLELAIFSRSSPSYCQTTHWAIKQHWFDYLPDSRRKSQKLSLVLLDCAGELPDLRCFAASWKRLDPKNRLKIRNFTVQAPLVEPSDGDIWRRALPPADLCQHWVEETALNGTLWDDVQNKHEAWLRDPGTRRRHA